MEAFTPLPTGARELLLRFLDLAYQDWPGCAQTNLHNAPDAAIAWQVQSALDDFADHTQLQTYGAHA